MKKRRILGAVITLAALSALIGIVSATGNGEELIPATLAKYIHVQCQGEELTMTDWSGQQLYPIVYNGSTYLPVRAIGDALGATVEWDDETKTVGLSEAKKPGTIDAPTMSGKKNGKDSFSTLMFSMESKDGEMLLSGDYFALDCEVIDLYVGNQKQLRDMVVSNMDKAHTGIITFTDAATGRILSTVTLAPKGIDLYTLDVEGVNTVRVTSVIGPATEGEAEK